MEPLRDSQSFKEGRRLTRNCVVQTRDTNSSKQGYKSEPGKEKARTLSYPILQDPMEASHLPKSRKRQKVEKLAVLYLSVQVSTGTKIRAVNGQMGYPGVTQSITGDC